MSLRGVLAFAKHVDTSLTSSDKWLILGSIIDDVNCGLVRFRGETDVDTLQRDPLNSKVARMLVTQPPISKFELAVLYVLAGGDVWSEYVPNPAGVTVGDVLRKLHEMRHAYEDSRGEGEWQWDWEGVYFRTQMAFPTEEQAACDTITNETDER